MKEELDELMKGYHGTDDMYGPDGLAKQLGYEKNSAGGKPAENRRNGKSSKTLRADQGAMEIKASAAVKGNLSRK
jgi:transposase-like protein